MKNEFVEYIFKVDSYSSDIYDFEVPFPCVLKMIDIQDGEMLDFYAFHSDTKRVKLNLTRQSLDVGSIKGEPVLIDQKFSMKIANREPYPYKVTIKIMAQRIEGSSK